MIQFVLVLILIFCGVQIGRLLEQSRVCRIMQSFFDREQKNAKSYTPDFINGMFYLGEYIKDFYK